MNLIQTMAAAVVLCIPLLAQEPPATTPGTGGGQAQAAKSFLRRCSPDGRVTFRLLAPKATEVLVQGNWEGGRGLAMTKDARGSLVRDDGRTPARAVGVHLFGGRRPDAGSEQLQRRARRRRIHEHAAGARRRVGGVPAAGRCRMEP